MKSQIVEDETYHDRALHAPLRGPAERPCYRTVFLSDLHLGTQGCEAEAVLAFLDHASTERLYLVGDIVDLWRLRVRAYWPSAHRAVIERMREMARGGTEVLYLPGNHDDALRLRIGRHFGQVRVVEDLVHITADGRRLLVLHGDGFDIVSRKANWLSHLGTHLYAGLQRLGPINTALGRPGHPERLALSGVLKRAVKRGVNVIGRYDAMVVAEARRRGVDGIVCGHVHRAELREIQGIVYANSGDWVESCTALVEHHDGTLAIVAAPMRAVKPVILDVTHADPQSMVQSAPRGRA